MISFNQAIFIALLVSLSACTITIIKPPSLSQQLPKIQYSLANYGNVPYGQTFYGSVAFASSEDGCSAIDEKIFSEEVEEQDNDSRDDSKDFSRGSYNSPIYMMRRGRCPFVQKSRNAEEANGKVAIVYNNQDNQEANSIILMDQSDHSGKGLMISTLFVSKTVADQFKNYLDQNPGQRIVLKIQFQRPKGNDKNKVRFWMSSMDITSYEFLNIFYQHYQDLKIDKVELEFSPHYITQEVQNKTEPIDHCISNGKYCSPEFKTGTNDMHNSQVLEEDIRQLILFKLDQELWWRYVFLFAENCVTVQRRDINECSKETLQDLKITDNLRKRIDSEVETSYYRVSTQGSSESILDNKLLDDERKIQYSQSASILPTLIFNGVYFRGDASSDSAIYEFICSSFDQKPQSCFNSFNEWVNFKNQRITKSQKSNYLFIVFLIVAALMIFIVIAFYYYRRVLKKQMQLEMGSQVNSAVSNYFALNDSHASKK